MQKRAKGSEKYGNFQQGEGWYNFEFGVQVQELDAQPSGNDRGQAGNQAGDQCKFEPQVGVILKIPEHPAQGNAHCTPFKRQQYQNETNATWKKNPVHIEGKLCLAPNQVIQPKGCVIQNGRSPNDQQIF